MLLGVAHVKNLHRALGGSTEESVLVIGFPAGAPLWGATGKAEHTRVGPKITDLQHLIQPHSGDQSILCTALNVSHGARVKISNVLWGGSRVQQGQLYGEGQSIRKKARPSFSVRIHQRSRRKGGSRTFRMQLTTEFPCTRSAEVRIRRGR